MRRILRHILFCSTIACFSLLCSKPPPLLNSEVAPLVAQSFTERPMGPMVAFGDVTVCNDGEKYSGSVEARWSADGTVSVDFYGPFGIILGSVRSTAAGGTVAFEEGTFTFAQAQTLDTLPFSWGRDLTFGELLMLITGRIPSTFQAFRGRSPDSLLDKKKTIIAFWETDSLVTQAEIAKRTRELAKVSFMFRRKPSSGNTGVASIGSFRQGIAHKIELRENDRNYFSIKYSKVKPD